MVCRECGDNLNDACIWHDGHNDLSWVNRLPEKCPLGFAAPTAEWSRAIVTLDEHGIPVKIENRE